MLRPELMTVAQGLASLETEELSLDHVAEAIGTLRVSQDELEALFTWLEAQGRRVGEVRGAGAAAELGEVLLVARGLRLELGRPPQPREIAERGGLSLEAVQRALWFARILQR